MNKEDLVKMSLYDLRELQEKTYEENKLYLDWAEQLAKEYGEEKIVYGILKEYNYSFDNIRIYIGGGATRIFYNEVNVASSLSVERFVILGKWTEQLKERVEEMKSDIFSETNIWINQQKEKIIEKLFIEGLE